MNEYIESNRALWDKWTAVHVQSDFYDVERFKRGGTAVGEGVRLAPHELEDVGDVAGKDLLHLQCHFGMDTLSWARLGACVTGMDFSPKAIAEAKTLARDTGVDARFVCADLYDLPNALEGTFDIVYTSNGVLGWLPDINRWAAVVAHFVRPGGIFYINEGHPIMWAMDDFAELPRPRHPYWSAPDQPLAMPVEGSYADPAAEIDHDVEYGWNHSLGEIVTALARAGLHIELLREQPFLVWSTPFLEFREDGTYRLPGELDGTMPLSYALRATKPA